jgi:pimeloyl-ACP methyl ester carboxylesterase
MLTTAAPGDILSIAKGGNGENLLVLLHGLGANASVWNRMRPLIEKSWQGRWIAPDFRGHGASPYSGPYGFGAHAADIAALIVNEKPGTTVILGHSFGGVVGALLATGWFGPQIARLFALGVKFSWTGDEIAKSHELARKPARVFTEKSDAIERYLKVAGLFGMVDQKSDEAAMGVNAVPGGFQTRMDPRAFAAVGPSIPAIFSQIKTPFHLLAGERDPMVSADEMRQFDKNALIIDGAGHNAHYEQPERVWCAVEARIAGGER